MGARLAIEGGPPARSRPDPGPVLAPSTASLGAAELEAVRRALERRTLYRYHGEEVAALEREFAAWLGRDVRALAVNSGSSAILLALGAAGVEPGDEVLVPTLGFVSAATAVTALGAIPRFVPVDASLGADLEAAAAIAGERTRALLAVHPYGSACDVAGARALCERLGLALVEDVAQACGATVQGRRMGTFGDAAAFSFQHFKLVSSGEGGMVVTGAQAVLDRAAFMHDAAAAWTWPEATARIERVPLAPGNLRMSELEGALARSQLRRCDELIARLRERKAPLASLAREAGVALRLHADAGGEAATHLVFSVGAAGARDAAWVAAALAAEGLLVAPLLGKPGANRHWAGDWTATLARCGAPPPAEDVVARDRETLAGTVAVTINPEWADRDLAESAEALGKVLGAL